jgi:hydrogenase maturation protease
MNTILCAGNRYCVEDSFGPLVYDFLSQNDHPSAINIIDAGLAGLDLLHHFENSDRVVVVDSVSGFGTPGELSCISYDELSNCETIEYGHSAGLHYLLLCLPALGLISKVEVILIGFNGIATTSITAAAASLALENANALKMAS